MGAVLSGHQTMLWTVLFWGWRLKRLKSYIWRHWKDYLAFVYWWQFCGISSCGRGMRSTECHFSCTLSLGWTFEKVTVKVLSNYALKLIILPMVLTLFGYAVGWNGYSWIQQIGDGTPFGMRAEWSKASRRGHSRLTQRTSAVYVIRWWWSGTMLV